MQNFFRGGAGSDTLRGMAGDDRLHSRDGAADTLVDCGAGAADVHAADATDAAGTGCETRQDATFSPSASTEAPELVGTPEIGETFAARAGRSPASNRSRTTSSGFAAGPACVEIQGAANQTYVAHAADLGKTLAVRVSASNEDGAGSAQSDQSEEIAPGPPPNVIVGDGSTVEGDDGSTTTVFFVSLSKAHMTTVTVDWATVLLRRRRPRLRHRRLLRRRRSPSRRRSRSSRSATAGGRRSSRRSSSRRSASRLRSRRSARSPS